VSSSPKGKLRRRREKAPPSEVDAQPATHFPLHDEIDFKLTTSPAYPTESVLATLRMFSPQS
jgi:hypothetical protein